MTAIGTHASMDQIILRLETIHRALRAESDACAPNPRLAAAVASCLGELRAIAARKLAETPSQLANGPALARRGRLN